MKSKFTFLMLMALLSASVVFAQERLIRGTVTDATSGEPLIGASVLLKGTTLGTVTDLNGNYSLEISTNDAVLVFSFTGFSPQEITVGNQTSINVTLEEDVTLLGEVVVVGYGTQEQKDISTSISTINAEDARDNPIPSVEGIIQGRAAGVNIVQSTGIPGQGLNVQIRGATSISATNQPLYVVDGIPMVSENNSILFTGGYTANSMADLNPNDIESISVLKDAAATAIYGSRGANGVILITTKRGKTGTPKINLNYYTGINQPTRRLDMLGSEDFLNMINEAAANDGFPEDYFTGGGPGWNTYVDLTDPNTELVETDWQDEIFQNGVVQNYDLSASGGNEFVRYYVGGSYHSNNGYLKNSNFERASARVNLDVKASEKLNFGTSISLSKTDQFRPISDNSLYGGPINALAGDPTMPVLESDGSYADPFAYASWWAFENPTAAVEIYERESFTNRALASAFAELSIVDGLKFRSNWSVDYKTLSDKSYIPSNAAQSFRNGIQGQGFYSTFQDYTYIIENVLSYEKTFGDHRISANLIQSVQESNSVFSSVFGQGYALDDLPNLALASEITDGSQNGTNWGISSQIFRANYTFRDKYIFSFTTRRDGSSRFGEQTRWGFFPAASAAWRVIDEDFMNTQTIFTDLKLRASYGITGNQEGINNFASRALWSTGASYDFTGAAIPSRLGNGNLGWESTASLDIGLDMSFLNNRITVTADYYNKQTSNLLLFAPVTSLSGFSGVTQNLGAIENKGFELAISSVNVDNSLADGFVWETDFNIAFNRNTIKELVNDNQRLGDTHILKEGEILGTYNMPVFLGVDPQTGDAQFDDINNDGIINNDDAQIVGSFQPDYFGGITNRFSYKGIDLSIFLQFMVGHEIFNRSRHAYENMGFAQNFGGYLQPYGNITQEAYDNRWQQPGDVTDYPRLSIGWGYDPGFNFTRLSPQYVEASTQFLEDGSYLRLKNVTLGYTLPEEVLGNIGIKSVRIYAQGQNLAILTGYKGPDPEVSSNGQSATSPGIDFGSLGPGKTYMVGVNLGF